MHVLYLSVKNQTLKHIERVILSMQNMEKIEKSDKLVKFIRGHIII